MHAIMLTFVAVALLATTNPAAAGSDKDKFDSLVGKYAVSGLGMPTKLEAKTLCYCTPGSVAPAYAAGYLVSYPVGGYTYVNCYVPIFAADGSFQGSQYCNAFAVVAK